MGLAWEAFLGLIVLGAAWLVVAMASHLLGAVASYRFDPLADARGNVTIPWASGSAAVEQPFVPREDDLRELRLSLSPGAVRLRLLRSDGQVVLDRAVQPDPGGEVRVSFAPVAGVRGQTCVLQVLPLESKVEVPALRPVPDDYLSARQHGSELGAALAFGYRCARPLPWGRVLDRMSQFKPGPLKRPYNGWLFAIFGVAMAIVAGGLLSRVLGLGSAAKES